MWDVGILIAGWAKDAGIGKYLLHAIIQHLTVNLREFRSTANVHILVVPFPDQLNLIGPDLLCHRMIHRIISLFGAETHCSV
jgi:hypothetical protein